MAINYKEVLSAYGLTEEASIVPHGTGLIHKTWVVSNKNKEQYILQQINTAVFRDPDVIAQNIERLGNYLKDTAPDYLFVQPLKTIDGKLYYETETDIYRLIPFVNGTHTVPVAKTTKQAFEAAKQFGKFSCLLHHFPVQQLKPTIPHFHDLSIRYQQFQKAITEGDKERREKCAYLIEAFQEFDFIETQYQYIKGHFPLRVMHHDTKISNVLLNANDEGVCVIDLDTVMPGYYISDTGDMFRTYLSPVSEEEKDFNLIDIRIPFFEAIVQGYALEMKSVMTPEEKEAFFYSGQFLIYMQALRFLTDYLNNDIYYGSSYEGHNKMRAENQLTLLKRYTNHEREFAKICQECLF
ncbi:MAG: aminoglycoside phosphotransferase family protein [Flavisolibacter sp.]|nr:aminoglycoside phosphotransferase family protein [Flavisolibacter sp.]